MTRLPSISGVIHGLGLLCSIAAVCTVLYYWDPTRVLFKLAQPAAAERYDQVPAEMQGLAPADRIVVENREQAQEMREKLLTAIFGNPAVPEGFRPRTIRRDVDKNPGPLHTCLSARGPAIVHLLSRLRTEIMRALGCEARFYAGWENLAGIDELTDYLAKDWPFTIGYFRPVQSNGRLIVYQHGLGGTYHDQHRLIEQWIKAGYTVAALNMPGYGDNTCYDFDRYCAIAPLGGNFASDMVYAFLPPIAAINHAIAQRDFARIAMVGLSSGSWITLTNAAIDTRIDLSLPVAGVMPIAMLRGKETSAGEIVKPLMPFAGVLDLVLLGADRKGRRQVQLFNQYDRCCFYGTRPAVYADDLANRVERLGGRFDVLFDRSHARHKISSWAASHIDAAIREGNSE